MTQAISTNTFTSATWIVNSNASKGTHTTLAGALASASSGDTILLQSSVTENPTLVAGVTIFAPVGSEQTPAVSITGKCTLTAAGTATISGIRLTTNSDYVLEVTGNAASVVFLDNCLINCTNNTGIHYTSSSASSSISLNNCTGILGTTGIGFFTATGAGAMELLNGTYNNLGASSTTSTTSATQIVLANVQFSAPLATTATGSFIFINSLINPLAVGVNATCLTTAGTGVSSVYGGFLQSGTASAVSIGTGTTVSFYGIVDIFSSNTNAITGAGTFGGNATFSSSSSLNNTTTKTAKNIDIAGLSFDFGSNIMSAYTVGTFTPTVVGGSTAGVTTYTTQTGNYVKIGKFVMVTFNATWTGATGTGTVLLGALPFTIANQQTYSSSIFSSVAIATATSFVLAGASAGTSCILYGQIAASGAFVSSNIAINTNNYLQGTFSYISTT